MMTVSSRCCLKKSAATAIGTCLRFDVASVGPIGLASPMRASASDATNYGDDSRGHLLPTTSRDLVCGEVRM
jgi:hypothetical protein